MSNRLRLNIDNAQTIIDIEDTSDFPVNGGVVQIEDEVISYAVATPQGIRGCTRGYNSTSAATHVAQLVVTLLTTPINQIAPLEFNASGAPTDNLTGVNIAPTGSRYLDSSTGNTYINSGDEATPTWSLISEGSGGSSVSSIHADSSADLTGDVQLVSGTNVTLSQSGQVITVNASGGGSSPNVVQAFDSTFLMTTSNTPVNTTLTVMITPSSSLKQIKVTAVAPILTGGATASSVFATIMRGSTNLADGHGATTPALAQSGDSSVEPDVLDTVTMTIIDSPATTDPVVYTVAIFNGDNSTSVHYNDGGILATIIAEEL